MTCKDLIESLADYLEGDLAVAERERLGGHLETCPRCTEYLDSYRKVIAASRLAAETSEEASPPDLSERIIDTLFRSRPK